MPAASAKAGIASRRSVAANIVAHANATAACPDGKELESGSEISGSGSGKLSGGRDREVTSLMRVVTRCAVSAAPPTRAKMLGRRHAAASAAAAISQTAPRLPSALSVSKNGSSSGTRWVTTQCASR